MKKNLLYAQSGGVTSVINTTAFGVIDEAFKHKTKINKIYAGKNGILGVLNEEIINVSLESKSELKKLRYTPGGAFGSCRLKLPDPKVDAKPYRRLVEIFQQHNIGYFLYNGGNDSQDTTNKIAQFCQRANVNTTCVGVPKTVDNDLVETDCCPGFGSVAKYIATTVSETLLDVQSMYETSTKLFIIEVMGRHAGWIAATGGLPSSANGPIIIAFPEVAHDWHRFTKMVNSKIDQHGFCVVVASEGLVDKKGKYITERGTRDSFAHAQLGGVAALLAEHCKEKLKVKYHWALADYMQRAARHLASKTDLAQAEAVGRHAVKYAVKGQGQVMPGIIRQSNKPYKWTVEAIPLAKVANREKKLPKNYITKDGYFITNACRQYLEPLISGEDHPPYQNGIPVHAKLKNKLIKAVLQPYSK